MVMLQADLADELAALEAQLPVNEILLYRLLAERKLQQLEAQSASDVEPAQAASENGRYDVHFSHIWCCTSPHFAL